MLCIEIDEDQHKSYIKEHEGNTIRRFVYGL
jgi:hypothetical protein